MLAFKKAKVLRILRKVRGRTDVLVDVDGRSHKAISYDALVGDVGAGDEVLVNTVAVDLGLGSGGCHFVLWNSKYENLAIPGDGHIMKLRYTPLQMACLAVEEVASPHHGRLKEAMSIEGMPVIAGTLHSQLAPAAAVIKYLSPRTRLAYVMTDGAALPCAFSDTVAELKEKGLLDLTITYGNAFGGDLEAVNEFSALVAARVVGEADVAVVAMGPGIAGTDTLLGFTGMEQGQIVNSVSSLGGYPIAIPRISFGDPRPRHRGLSYHTEMALCVAARARCQVAFPELPLEKRAKIEEGIKRAKLDERHEIKFVDAGVVKKALDHFRLKPTTMGRGYEEDPEFFMAAGAAAICALDRLGSARSEKPASAGNAKSRGVSVDERSGGDDHGRR